MCSPSALLTVNYLVMRCLHFESLRGELQEGHFYASRCQFPVCSSTKMAILCSGSPKMGGSEGKSAQKPRFCARNARKWGFRRQKAHKNLDFVLEMPENGGSRPQKRTKTLILCSEGRKMRVPKAKSAQIPRFCAREARKSDQWVSARFIIDVDY